MRVKLFAFSVVLALACPAFSQTMPRGVEQKATLGGITEYAYPNGLRVLLFPDPSNPKVTVNMTYLVGSRFEGYGETGMAHLLEHLNFIRSTHNREIKKELTDHGAQWNGTTDYDRTNYFETVTASDDNLRWALGLEAERMVNMRMEKALLDTEMTVVRNEFERGENSAAEHPRGARHRHRLPVAQLRQVGHRLARRHRARADRSAGGLLSQVLPAGQRGAGHRRTVRRRRRRSRWWPTRSARFPADAHAGRTYTVEPAQDGERFVELRRVGSNQIVMAAWHAPALAHPDSAALEVLTGVMVGGGGGRGGGAGTGRLYKALVDSKKALTVRMSFQELHDPGFVIASATLSNEQSLDDVRKTMLDTIAAVATDPPTADEVARAKTRILQGMETRMANSQQAALGLTRNHRVRRLASAASSTTIRSSA